MTPQEKQILALALMAIEGNEGAAKVLADAVEESDYYCRESMRLLGLSTRRRAAWRRAVPAFAREPKPRFARAVAAVLLFRDWCDTSNSADAMDRGWFPYSPRYYDLIVREPARWFRFVL